MHEEWLEKSVWKSNTGLHGTHKVTCSTQISQVISFLRSTISYLRNNISFLRNTISFLRNIISYIRNTIS